MEDGLKIEKQGNPHSFTMSSHGYRLVFKETDEELPPGYPYCYKFGILSFDSRGEYAGFGIGKKKRNSARSFLDGVEMEMLSLQKEKEQSMEAMRELERKMQAIDDFLEALPKVFIDDGVHE